MSSPTAVLVNGVAVAQVSALDRGLQFGDGLFETIACVQGRPRFLPLHLERLESGCQRLQMPGPPLEAVAAELTRLAAGADRSLLKLMVTAGEAQVRGYGRSKAEQPTRITIQHPWPQEDPRLAQDGIIARTVTLRLGENPRLAGLKHCNRLEQVLARAELAADREANEGIVFSSSGNLVSGIMSNIFLVREGVLLTPRLDLCGVQGVLRRVLLREARQAAIPVRECELHAADLAAADEVLFTNARVGIWPVQRLDGRTLQPGPVTRHLQQLLLPLLDGPDHA